MNVLRVFRQGVIGVLVLIWLAGPAWSGPVAAQDDPAAAIEALALRAHRQDLRAHSYTAWIGGSFGDPESTPLRTPIGERLDDWTLAGFAGDADFAADQITRPVLLNFWASWCPPCRLEFPHLVSVALKPDDHAFDVVFVNMADESRDAMVYLSQYPDTIVTVRDEDERLVNRASITSIPTSLLLDADGTVLVVHVGMLTPTITAFLDAVASHPGVGAFDATRYMDETPRAVLAPIDRSAAPLLVAGDAVTGTITGAAFQRAYRFAGHAGEVVDITLTAESGELDTYLVLMTADGTRLAENDDVESGAVTDSRIQATLPADGEYIIVATRFLEAEGFGEGDFRLTLAITPAAGADGAVRSPEGEPSSPQEAGRLRYGETVRGTLDDAQYEMRWSFEGRRGDVIRAVMAAVDAIPGGLDGYLILEGPDGAVIQEVDDANHSVMPVIDGFELPADGTYTLVATRFGFANGFSAGDFTLTLEQIGGLPALGAEGGGQIRWLPPGTLPEALRWLPYNAPVEGEITSGDFDDWYIFQGRAGDVVTLRMEAVDNALDPFLILTDGAGYELARNDDASHETVGASIAAFTLPADGAYLVRATRYGFEHGLTAGAYVLELQTEAEPAALRSGEPIPLAWGEVVTGTLALDAPALRYVVAGRAGDQVTILAERADGDLVPALLLHDAAGDELAASRAGLDDTQARIAQVILPQDGPYTITVMLDDLLTTGSFRLVALSAPPVPLPESAFEPASGLDVELVLIWASSADLELHAVAADGTSGTVTARAQDFCVADEGRAPVERIVWDEGTAPAGRMVVEVIYRLNCGGQTGPVRFRLAVAVKGEVIDLIDGTLPREGDRYMTFVEVAP